MTQQQRDIKRKSAALRYAEECGNVACSSPATRTTTSPMPGHRRGSSRRGPGRARPDEGDDGSSR